MASITGWILRRRPHDVESQSTIVNLNARIRAWMIAIFLLAMLSGGLGSVVLSLG
jgi:predicted CDP-diglyceride synthetase/phosphatidate cytidylyltransferase